MTKSAVEEQHQAKETPLTELLRNIPADYRASIPFQWAEDGRETGHHLIPVGRLAHRAAEELDRLRAEREGKVLVPRDELLRVARLIEDLKLPCSFDNPESKQAIRNGHYQSIALIVRAMLAAAEEESRRG